MEHQMTFCISDKVIGIWQEFIKDAVKCNNISNSDWILRKKVAFVRIKIYTMIGTS